MNPIPAAFSPRTVAGRQVFTVRIRRGWAPWAVIGLAFGCGIFGVSLFGVINGASALFLVATGLLLSAGGWMQRNEVTAIDWKRSDFAEVTRIEVLGDEQPVLMVLREGRAPEYVDASGHTAEDARALAAALGASVDAGVADPPE